MCCPVSLPLTSPVLEGCKPITEGNSSLSWKKAGEFVKAHGVQALSIESAGACAEWLRPRIRKDWGAGYRIRDDAGPLHVALPRQALQAQGSQFGRQSAAPAKMPPEVCGLRRWAEGYSLTGRITF